MGDFANFGLFFFQKFMHPTEILHHESSFLPKTSKSLGVSAVKVRSQIGKISENGKNGSQIELK